MAKASAPRATPPTSSAPAISTQRLLAALSAPVRREILWLAWDRELAAGDIVDACNLSAATISGHLKVLHDTGLLTRRVDGTFRRYRTDRAALAGVRHLLTDEATKWQSKATPGLLASTRRRVVVTVSTDAVCDAATAYRAFTDAAIYREWSAMPVSLDNGNFSAEFGGRRVRGHYDHTIDGALIVMTWDFASDDVPVPGGGWRAYLELTDLPSGGCHLELHQLADNDEQARFLERAWGLLIERFRAHAAATRRTPTRESGNSSVRARSSRGGRTATTRRAPN